MPCNHKHFVDLPDGRRVAVPCGFCAVCRAQKRDQWQTRLEIEQLYQEKLGYGNTFLTLTVADETPVPVGEEKRVIQLFWKRIRKSLPDGANPSFKYFLVSEYGSQTGRLHYHAIVLGLDFALHARCFRENWSYGFIMSLPIRPGAIRYVLKYIDKCRSTKREKEIYESLGVAPPVRLISKGIALQFFQDNQFALINSNGLYRWHSKDVLAPEYVCRKLGIHPSKNAFDPSIPYQNHNSYVFEKTLIARSRNNNEPVYSFSEADYLAGRIPRDCNCRFDFDVR